MILSLSRRQFIKSMVVGAALMVVPLSSGEVVNATPQAIEDMPWDPEDWEVYFSEEIIKPAAQKLADDVDKMIGHMITHGEFPK